MPRVFKYNDIIKDEKEIQRDYFDRHSPRIVCQDTVHPGEKVKVKVIVGNEYAHPDQGDHHIGYIQLWDLETLLAECRLFPGILAGQPGHIEVDFYVVPKVSMRLCAMSYCSKHGLWQSETYEVKMVYPEGSAPE